MSGLFTVTRDLDAAFPARAAEEYGWNIVALLHATEIPVPGSLPMCIRLLVHAYTAASAGGNQALLSARGHRPPARPGVTAVRVTARGAERWVRGPSLDLSQRGGGRPRRRRARAGARSPRPLHRPGAPLPHLRDPAPAARADRPRRWTAPGGASASPRAPRAGAASMPPPTAWCMARATASPRWSSTATTAGWSCRSSRPGSRPCATAIVDALDERVPPRRDPAPATTPPCAGARAWTSRSSWRAARCRARSRSAKAAFATWPRPGTARRPAPSSISAPTACSPARWRRRAAGRSTASPTTAPSPSTWPDAPRSVLALDASPEALRRGAANAALNGLGNIEWREGDAFETLRAFARAQRAVRHHRPRPARRSPRTGARSPPRSAATARSTSARCAPGPRRDPAHRQLLVPCPPARVPHHARRGRRRQRAADPPAPDPWPGRGPSRGADHPRNQLSQGRGARRRSKGIDPRRDDDTIRREGGSSCSFDLSSR